MTGEPYPDDERAILDLHDEFGEAWGRGDVDALAAMFTDDGVRVGAIGGVLRGREEIRAGLRRMFLGPFAGMHVEVGQGSVRMLGRDLALWQAPITVFRPGAPGIPGYVLDVMKKVGSRWLILETHPKLFPPR